MTLSKLDEGIVKINSKVLESSELKKFDKLEKEGITSNGSVLKGKVSGYILINYVFATSCVIDVVVCTYSKVSIKRPGMK